MESQVLDFFGLLILFFGFILGLGAVTVIDIHGFLGRESHYWTEATVRTHKVTKPLIWVGTILVLLGSLIFYRNNYFEYISLIQFTLLVVMFLNGIFLSFKVSPFLLKREKQGKSSELLPKSWQRKIAISLVFSDICWWASVLLLVYYLIFINA